jgi:hypothetical protein
MYSLSQHPTKSYLWSDSSYDAYWTQYLYELFCLIDPSYLVSPPPGLEKIEILSLAPEHIINPDELQFLIGLPTDWQSLIEPLYSNQAERLHLRHNSCFIFLFDVLLHWYHEVGDVFNMTRSPYDFNFYLIYTGISHWWITELSSKKFLHILFWLVVTSIL